MRKGDGVAWSVVEIGIAAVLVVSELLSSSLYSLESGNVVVGGGGGGGGASVVCFLTSAALGW